MSHRHVHRFPAIYRGRHAHACDVLRLHVYRIKVYIFKPNENH